MEPQTIPMAEETILWFEFLLKPSLLTQHLNKNNAIETMQKFLATSDQQPNNDLNEVDTLNKNEGLKIGRKQLALKILALKVASYLNFNLEMFEKCLPIQKQVQLLSDLCSITSGRLVNLPLSLVHEVPIAAEGNKSALNFALTLYHRWVLRAQVLRGSYTKIKPFINIISGPEQNNYSIQDDLFITSLEPFTPTSIDFLNQIISDPDPFKVLTYDSFVPLDANVEKVQKFESAITISKTEIKTQIYYDLCFYYMYVKKYELAKQNILLCRDNFALLQKEYEKKGKLEEFVLCTVTEDELRGYQLACGVFDEKANLLQKLNESMLNGYVDIVKILKDDNVVREIPVIHRKNLELDIEAACTIPSRISVSVENPKELELQIVAANAIRYILEEDNILTSDTFQLKYKNHFVKIFEHFIEFSNEIQKKLTLSEQGKIKNYLLNIFLANNSTQVESLMRKSSSFSKKEIDALKLQLKLEEPAQLSGIGVQSDWLYNDSKIPRIEVGILERQLITSTTANGVRKILVKLIATNPTQPLFTINNNWIIPLQLKQVVLSLPRGFLQDFAYILLGKAREMLAKRDYQGCISLLNVLKNETQRGDANNQIIVKLGKLVITEILFVQVLQSFEEWPKKPIDQQLMAKNIKQCLLPLQQANPSTDIPRMEIVDNCVLMLLNLNEWTSCTSLDSKRNSVIELSAAFSTILMDLEKFKSKKCNRDVWDLVLPLFATNQSQAAQKRSSSVSGKSNEHSIPQTTLALSIFRQFLEKLRDPLTISILLSMLAKIHNLLKDETQFDLNMDHMYLWPTNITNSTIYNIKLVSEMLAQLLKQSLKFYPNQLSWLKLKGDLEFVGGNHEMAMKFYVQSLILATEYCTLPIQRPLIEDHIVKKMVKCSSNLGCFMQAAVLCQFQDDIDYSLAFKCVSEKTFSDATDSYYYCIWDPTLLEFIINLHYKKGEHKRRLHAISHMSQLELNWNNNDEIKREASSIRKIKFVRALARQYL